MTLQEIGQKAKEVSHVLGILGTEEKNRGLRAVADALVSGQDGILAANEKDMEKARENGMSQGLLDRLKLTPARIEGMAEGLRQVADLEDPVGEVISMKQRPNGLMIGQKRVPLGVIGMIYEARPNVTADAFGLCFKSGNAVILKGGSDAIYSNLAIVEQIRKGLSDAGLPEDAVLLIADTSRAVTRDFMKLNEYVDVLIPRGGAGLIRNAVENATVPVIETGTGNCHVYFEKTASIEKALPILINAKTQRTSVCNACESLLIDASFAQKYLRQIVDTLSQYGVEIVACQQCRDLIPELSLASEEDFYSEFLALKISAKIVSGVEEAIAHINKYGTHHSDCIVTEDAACAEKFLKEVDSAAVYWNASTRFTDGFEFGLGAEMGISTQKLHARGPMGLRELTSYKYQIIGNGQIRS